MPTVNEKLLWQAIAKKNYQAVENLIKQEPDLVNSKKESNNMPLLIYILGNQRPLPVDLIKFITKHEQLQLDYKKGNINLVERLVYAGNYEVFSVFETKIELLLRTGEGQLSYDYARTVLEDIMKVYETDRAQGVIAPESVRFFENKIKGLEAIITKLGEKIVEYAIKNDNTKLLDDLKNAEFNFSKSLSSGKKPIQLVTNSKSQAKVWFDGLKGMSAMKDYNNASLALQDLQLRFFTGQANTLGTGADVAIARRNH